MQATVYNLAGAAVGTVELNDAIFGITPNEPVVHQAVLRQQANARLGTHDTKTRAEVSGGGRKPWRQKGTGHARQGSTRAPQWRHGGVVFGPHPRSYNQDLPRKMRRLAMRSVLSDKAASGSLLIVDDFADLQPKTKAMLGMLDALKVRDRRVLIMTPAYEANLEQAAGNVPGVNTMRTQYLSLVAMLKADVVMLSRPSLEVIEQVLGSTGGRRPHPVTLTEAEAAFAPKTAESPLSLPVEQMAGASAVTADVVTAAPPSRGVAAAVEEAATEHNAAAETPEGDAGESHNPPPEATAAGESTAPEASATPEPAEAATAEAGDTQDEARP